MTNTHHALADVLRDVTLAMQQAIAEGHRSRMINADDLVEVLLSIADRLDPPVTAPRHEVDHPCPGCGERNTDLLLWQDDETVRCVTCGTTYVPGD